MNKDTTKHFSLARRSEVFAFLQGLANNWTTQVFGEVLFFLIPGAKCKKMSSSGFSIIWSNYSDLTRPHPKWWLSKGNPLISGKPRLVKYYTLARIMQAWQPFFCFIVHREKHRVQTTWLATWVFPPMGPRLVNHQAGGEFFGEKDGGWMDGFTDGLKYRCDNMGKQFPL